MKRSLMFAALALVMTPTFGQSLLGLPTPILVLPGAPVLDLADPLGSVQGLLTETSIPLVDPAGAAGLGLPLQVLEPVTSTLAPLPVLGPILQP